VFLCGILVGMMTMAYLSGHFFVPEQPESEAEQEEPATAPTAPEMSTEPAANSSDERDEMMNSFMLMEAVMEYDVKARATVAHLCEKRNFKGARDRRRGCKLCVLVYPIGGEKLFISSCGKVYHTDAHCTGLRKAVTVRPCLACRCDCSGGSGSSGG
jgi:hypothetical protein